MTPQTVHTHPPSHTPTPTHKWTLLKTVTPSLRCRCSNNNVGRYDSQV